MMNDGLSRKSAGGRAGWNASGSLRRQDLSLAEIELFRIASHHLGLST
jgi:hypothetical protein